jgi:hypothetical protein
MRPLKGLVDGWAGESFGGVGADQQGWHMRDVSAICETVHKTSPPRDLEGRRRSTLALIRAAARWDQLDEATVTIECLARDAAAAAEAARAIIRRTARLTGQIGVRDIKVAKVAPAS